MVLSALGLVTPEFLRSKRRHAIVLITVLASFLTPGDVITLTIMLMVPLFFLYEFSIFLSRLIWRKKREREREEERASERGRGPPSEPPPPAGEPSPKPSDSPAGGRRPEGPGGDPESDLPHDSPSEDGRPESAGDGLESESPDDPPPEGSREPE
jgi:hypothetical protein